MLEGKGNQSDLDQNSGEQIRIHRIKVRKKTKTKKKDQNEQYQKNIVARIRMTKNTMLDKNLAPRPE